MEDTSKNSPLLQYSSRAGTTVVSLGSWKTTTHNASGKLMRSVCQSLFGNSEFEVKDEIDSTDSTTDDRGSTSSRV